MSVFKEHDKSKLPNIFALELSAKRFIVPSKGFLKIELKNLDIKPQEVLITLESVIFTLENHQKKLPPIEQLCMILSSSETRSCTISVNHHFPEPFESSRLLNPEGHLTISHCDTKREDSGDVKLNEYEGLMCLASDTDEGISWGSITQNLVLDMETMELKKQKERYFNEKREHDKVKSRGQLKQELSKGSAAEKQNGLSKCCSKCTIG